MSEGLTLKKFNELLDAVVEGGGPAPDSIIVSMTDEEFETAKANGVKVSRIEL